MVTRVIKEFIKLESMAGAVLIVAAVLALIIDNTYWAPYYHWMFNQKITLPLGIFHLI